MKYSFCGAVLPLLRDPPSNLRGLPLEVMSGAKKLASQITSIMVYMVVSGLGEFVFQCKSPKRCRVSWKGSLRRGLLEEGPLYILVLDC